MTNNVSEKTTKKEFFFTLDVPDWAKYQAIDESGDFCVFAEKPFLVDENLCGPGEGIFDTKDPRWMLLGKNHSTVNWKESLTEIVTPVIN